MPVVHHVNSLLESGAANLSRAFPMRVEYVDCGDSFVNPASARRAGGGQHHAGPSSAAENEVQLELMYDALHPTPKGTRVWADCLQPALEALHEGRGRESAERGSGVWNKLQGKRRTLVKVET